MLIDKKNIFHSIIIGSGPAGMTAAIYLKRANKNILIIEKNVPGGKIITTSDVENYPGYKYISGPDLSYKMYEQCNELNIPFKFDEVIKIEKEKELIKITTLSGEEIFSYSVVIATGMVNRKLNIKNEDKFQNKGISYCAICDGALFKDKKIVVIGSGRTAIDETLMLSNIAKEIILISNKEVFKADQITIDKVKKLENVKIIMETNTLEFNGDNVLESVLIENQKTKEKTIIKIDGAFIFIGFIPISPNNTFNDFYSNIGFIKVNQNMETIIPGVYAAGDIIQKEYRQITTAVNDGTIAALSIIKYIEQFNK